MLLALSQRLLPFLQLTRMALVFTAIADAVCGLLLHYARLRRDHQLGVLNQLDPYLLVATALISVGLYAFGMSLNDIVDHRRDMQLAAHRPLPSGRIGMATAHLICAFMGVAAILGALYFVRAGRGGWISLLLVVWTGLLITFYDTAGKYLVWPGLICLGLIRFFQSLIAAPEIPVLWHPLLLLNHVAILSAIAYAWEQKRPALTRSHVWGVALMLLAMNGSAIALCAIFRRGSLWATPGLLAPAGAALAFAAIALLIRRRAGNQRQAGQTLMLYGLLWLIVYDACFVAAYVNGLAGVLLFLLLPIAHLSVQVMRWWSKVIAAAQTPQYKRAGT